MSDSINTGNDGTAPFSEQQQQPQQFQQPQQQAPSYEQPVYANGTQAGQSGPYYQQQAPYANTAWQPTYYAVPPANIPAGYVPRQKIVAGLLGIFLGGLGVHNFYLGKTGPAIAQLLMTILGYMFFFFIVPILLPLAAGIWGLVEGILILCSNQGTPWHRDGLGIELKD